MGYEISKDQLLRRAAESDLLAKITKGTIVKTKVGEEWHFFRVDEIEDVGSGKRIEASAGDDRLACFVNGNGTSGVSLADEEVDGYVRGGAGAKDGCPPEDASGERTQGGQGSTTLPPAPGRRIGLVQITLDLWNDPLWRDDVAESFFKAFKLIDARRVGRDYIVLKCESDFFETLAPGDLIPLYSVLFTQDAYPPEGEAKPVYPQGYGPLRQISPDVSAAVLRLDAAEVEKLRAEDFSLGNFFLIF